MIKEAMTITPITQFFFIFAVCFLAVLILMPLARKLAIYSGFTDAPGGRKQHDKPVPPVGGLVIFPVFVAGSFFYQLDVERHWPLYSGMLVLLVMGALDDRWHLPAWPKFFIQIGVAMAVVLSGGARLYQLGDLFGFGNVGLDIISIPFSIAAIALLINAINLMDGLDGLAGGFGFLVLFWLALAAIMAGAPEHALMIAPLSGSLAGFLYFNLRNPWRRKASIFLGDSGALALGLALAWFCINLSQEQHQIMPPISIAWILALPIIDTCAQFYRRRKEGRHPFAPDRGHFHHHLIHAGMPVILTTGIILFISFLLGAIGFSGARDIVPQWALTAGWIALLLSHMALSRRSEFYISFFQKFFRLSRGG